MSIVTGTGGGTGGSTSYFSSFLATTNKSAPAQPTTGSVTGTVGDHTLSTPEIASHNHDMRPYVRGGSTGSSFIHYRQGDNPAPTPPTLPVTSTGGGGAHSHPFSGSLGSASTDVTIPAADVQYANVIVANKD
jgi:hypothetical protein